MKTISPAFLTMLQDSASLVEADLYTFTLASGTVLYYTSAQQNIVYGSNTYLAASTPGLGSILNNGFFANNTSGTPFGTALTAGASVSDGWSVSSVASGHQVFYEAAPTDPFAVVGTNDVLIRLVGGTSVPAGGSINTYVMSGNYTVTGGAPFTLAIVCGTSSNISLPSGITVKLRTYINWFTASGTLITSSIQDLSGNTQNEQTLYLNGNAPPTSIFAQVVMQAICANANGSATTVGTAGQLPADMRWYGLTLTEHSTPGFHRGTCRCTRGLDTDELEVDILFDSSTQILGQTPAGFANAGGFDNAFLKVDKALAPNWSNPVVNGVVNIFSGVIGESKSDSNSVQLTVSSMLIYLSTTFPRNYALPQCNHSLFDSGCGLAKSTYAVSGTVSTTAGASTISTFNSNCTQATGWFALGYIVWTSGANNGITCSVKAFTNANGAFQLIYPLDSPPANGDTFTAYPGCDKLQATCTTKFANVARYRGFPYVPTPETLEVGGTGSVPPVTSGGTGGSGISQIPRGPGGLNANFKYF